MSVVKSQTAVSGVSRVFKSRKRTRTLASILALAVLVGLIYFGRSYIVAAFVNGRPILRLSLVKELERKQGKTTLDSLVQKELITQEAQKKNITITNEDVQKEIDKITKAVEAQGVTLDAALSYQGQTRTDLEENIRIQKTLEILLADKLSVSEGDVKKYFEDNKAVYGTNPDYEQLKDSISDQLKQEKLSGEFQAWMDSLKKDSKIIYFVSY
ncbi:hypothetical protein A2962_04830 [Candidatus Woesebacteria bacterium RIFCSPLOWO2_01_FULL_39_61]|nr:MAG: hypothetical protein A2962_04830 [Candidatus Woesebacteria bacterium RIFCSPLOWO2_01_FULL_39_61]